MRRNAFTLVELLISLALALIIIVGVNYVFASVSETVGTGQALSESIRDHRAASNTLKNDFEAIVPMEDAPALVIRMMAIPSFMDRIAEEQGMPEDRRADIVGFFIKSETPMNRQTGNNGEFISSGTAMEAYVWYGHLMQPDSDGTFWLPGDGTASDNADNYHARNWILGRVSILLDPLAPQQSFVRTSGLTPLASDSATQDGTRLFSSRYDVARTRIRDYREVVRGTDNFWIPLLNFRHRTSIYPARPLTSEAAALSSTAFLRGCTSFKVEFAGDFDGVDGIDMNAAGGVRWYGLDDKVGDSHGSQSFEHNAPGDQYIVAWSSDDEPKPAMIRITIRLDDRGRRLADGMTMEHVFNLP